MTAEQRTTRLHEINEEKIKLRNEERELLLADRLDTQQDCLQWVGRAFVVDNATYLVTSVPPIVYRMQCDSFNRYQYPCIKIPSKVSEPPVFDETLFIGGCYQKAMKEIPLSEFQSLLHERLDYLLKRAATAKMRQQGKEVYTIDYKEICEK